MALAWQGYRRLAEPPCGYEQFSLHAHVPGCFTGSPAQPSKSGEIRSVFWGTAHRANPYSDSLTGQFHFFGKFDASKRPEHEEKL